MPANGEGSKVGAADRDRPRSLEALDDGGVQPRIRARERLEPLRGRRPGEVDVPFDREGDAVERREITASGDRTVSRLRGFEGLLGQHDRDGVDRGVHGLDAPEVGLDDFLTGNLPGSDGFGQLQGAHAPEVGSCDAHVYTPLYGRLRRRKALTVLTTASAPSARVSEVPGLLVAGRFKSDNGCDPRSA